MYCFVVALLTVKFVVAHVAGREDVSEMRPRTGPLFITQVIYGHGQPRWNDTGIEKNRI